MTKEYTRERTEKRETWEEEYKNREGVRESMNSSTDIERLLLEAIHADDTTQTEELVQKAIEDAAEAKIDMPIRKVANKILTNVKIKTIMAKLTNALENYELEIVQACCDQVENEDIVIDEELRIKAEELIYQAETNPNFIAEKQAEIKKQTKGKPGKK